MIALTKRERAESRVCLGYVCRGLRRMHYAFEDGLKVCDVCSKCPPPTDDEVAIAQAVKLCNTCHRPNMEYRVHPSGKEYIKCRACGNQQLRESVLRRKQSVIKGAMPGMESK